METENKERLEKIRQLKEQIIEEEKLTLKELAEEQALNELHKPKPKIFDTIPKKTAALEVKRHLETSKKFILGAIVAPFIVSLGGVFNTMVGAGFAVVAALAFGYYFVSMNKEIARLKQEYGV